MAKILLVANTSFFIHHFLSDLTEALKNSGHDIGIVAPEDEYYKQLRAQGYNFIGIRSLSRKSANPLKDIRLFLELYGIYRNEKPNLLLHFTIKPNVYGTLASILTKNPSVCTVTGLGWLFTEKSIATAIGSFLYRILYRIAFSYSRRVVFLNGEDMEYFVERRIVKEAKTVLTPGSGVDTEYFSPNSCRVSQPQNGITFLLIARMLWDKGIGEFVEAAKIVKEKNPLTDFQLLGPLDYDSRSAIPETAIRRWEDEGAVQYLGRTEDVRPFICKSDAVVLPSYYREGVPTVLLEAMAMEKPVITTDNVGCREAVDENKNGLIISIKDSKALADAMLQIIDIGAHGRKEMGKRGREKVVKEFDRKIVTSAYMDIVGEMAERTV